jgi:hypothetical protein
MQYVDYKEFENNHKAYLSISDVDKKTGWSTIGFVKVIVLLAVASFSFNSKATSTFDQFDVESKINESVNSNDIVYSGKGLKAFNHPSLL